MHESGHRQLFVVLGIAIAIDGEVDYGEEGVGVNVVILAGFLNGLVAEAQVDAKASQHLQEVVVIAYQRYHLVVGLVHLLISHTFLIYS